jgi:hypothetical protein
MRYRGDYLMVSFFSSRSKTPASCLAPPIQMLCQAESVAHPMAEGQRPCDIVIARLQGQIVFCREADRSSKNVHKQNAITGNVRVTFN